MNIPKKQFPFHIILFPIFYLLHNYNEIFGFITAPTLISFGIALILFTGICFLVAYFFIRSSQIAAILTSFLLLFTLYFGPYHDFIKSIANPFISSYKIIIPFSLLAIISVSVFFIKKNRAAAKFTSYLNILFILLISFELFKFAANFKKFKSDQNLIYTNSICNNYKPSFQTDSLKPDIYFIIFDAYTNNKTLNKFWNFDNSHITNWLSDEGFYIIPNGSANYNFTPYSVSSTLNMNYLPPEKSNWNINRRYILEGVKSISNNETLCLLNKENYHIQFLAPFKNDLSDPGLVIEFEDLPASQLYRHTLPGRAQHDILWNFTPIRPPKDKKSYMFWTSEYGDKKKRIEDVHRSIEEIKATSDSSTNRKPQFVYGHFMTTHQPHLFDSTGKPRSKGEIEHMFDTYTDQVTYSNKVIKNLVEHIKLKNKKNTVIIILGDHGYRDRPSYIQANEFSNFGAIYFPDRNYSKLYDSLSSVNVFRVLFNHYFYQNFELLKDSSINVNY